MKIVDLQLLCVPVLCYSPSRDHYAQLQRCCATSCFLKGFGRKDLQLYEYEYVRTRT